MLLKNILILSFLLFTLSNANNKITLQLDWLHQFQFAGYYIAKEKGFYKENNLDVTINEFNYNLNLLDNVLNNPNTYSVGKSSLVIDKLHGKEIVLLSAIYQNSPMVLLTLKKSNISSISDLKSKKIMLTSDARSAANITSMIKSQGMKLNDIDFIPHSFKLDDLINGKTDAMGSYLSNEPFTLENKGIEFNILNPKEYGFDFYGGILFTSKNEVEDNPLRVKNFYDASIKGWKYAFENIEETAQIIYDKYNTQNKTLNSLIYEGKILKELSKINKGLLGSIDKKKIQELKRLYLVLGFSKNSNLYIEEFIYDKNKILFNDHENKLMQESNITLLTNTKNTPYSFKINDQISGMEIDIWNLIGGKLNKKFNIIEKPPSNNVLNSISTNSVYLDFNYNKNDINEKTHLLSKPIISVSMAIATTKEKNLITDLAILNNIDVALLEGNNLYYELKDKYPNIRFVKVKNLQEAFLLIEEKKIFGVIDNILTLSHKINAYKYKNIKVIGTLPNKLQLRLSTTKDNEVIINILDKIIMQISKSDKDFISNKYHMVLYEQINDYSWIYKFILPLIILLILILIVNNKMRREIKKRKHAEKALKDYANRDSLTKVYNRRKIEKLMSTEIKRARRFNNSLSIIFFDIDDFKIINDNFGHIKGDQVLIELSKTVALNIRETDSIGRWGGEEFIIILPQTSVKEAEKLALILKELIINIDFTVNKKVTSSFGITDLKKDDHKKDMIKRADEAMYFVKKNGKNSIKVY